MTASSTLDTVLAAPEADVEPLIRSARAGIAVLALHLRTADHEAEVAERAADESDGAAVALLRKSLDEVVEGRRRELGIELAAVEREVARLVDDARRAADLRPEPAVVPSPSDPAHRPTVGRWLQVVADPPDEVAADRPVVMTAPPLPFAPTALRPGASTEGPPDPPARSVAEALLTRPADIAPADTTPANIAPANVAPAAPEPETDLAGVWGAGAVHPTHTPELDLPDVDLTDDVVPVHAVAGPGPLRQAPATSGPIGDEPQTAPEPGPAAPLAHQGSAVDLGQLVQIAVAAALAQAALAPAPIAHAPPAPEALASPARVTADEGVPDRQTARGRRRQLLHVDVVLPLLAVLIVLVVLVAWVG